MTVLTELQNKKKKKTKNKTTACLPANCTSRGSYKKFHSKVALQNFSLTSVAVCRNLKNVCDIVCVVLYKASKGRF